MPLCVHLPGPVAIIALEWFHMNRFNISNLVLASVELPFAFIVQAEVLCSVSGGVSSGVA